MSQIQVTAIVLHLTPQKTKPQTQRKIPAAKTRQKMLPKILPTVLTARTLPTSLTAIRQKCGTAGAYAPDTYYRGNVKNPYIKDFSQANLCLRNATKSHESLQAERKA
jgi:hypothetical protein